MASVNKVILVGHLGADPEFRYTRTEPPRAQCTIRLATSYKPASGAKELVEWHRVVVWGDNAENCQKYLSKGRQVYIDGRIQTRSYDKEGIKHYVTEIVTERIVFLGAKPTNDNQATAPDPGDDVNF